MSAFSPMPSDCIDSALARRIGPDTKLYVMQALSGG
jgi:hypothetical protein